MRRVHIVVAGILALAAVAALAAVYLTQGPARNVAGAPDAPTPPGESAPAGAGDSVAAFVRHAEPKSVGEVSFNADGGEARALADWRGRTVLVNLWATWCGPCRHEMPSLDRLQAELGGDGFEVVAISLDRGGFDKPRAFYEEIGIENLALYNDETMGVSTALGVIGMPTTLLIDAEGREVGRLTGPAEWDSPEAMALVRDVAATGS